MRWRRSWTHFVGSWWCTSRYSCHTRSIKDWRRIHTRCDRCHTFMSAIATAATVIFWLDQ